MKHDEGTIKFAAHWRQTPALTEAKLSGLIRWRNELHRRGLIGAYPDGIGFGNISRRWDADGRFVISGSATGRYTTLSAAHFSLVTDFNPDKNTVYCEGPVVASSESMSHAAIYRECPEVSGVIHVHHLAMWKRLLRQAATTDAAAAYGTPEMAASIVRLLRETNVRQQKIFAMTGHWEGVFAFGKTLDEAAELIFSFLKHRDTGAQGH